MLKAFDNGLHGRIQQLEKEKEELLNEGKQRLTDGKAKINLAKEVAVAEAIPHAPNPTQQLENEKEENPAAAKNKVVAAPSGTKRLLDGNGDASCSKRYREQSESELATKFLAEYVKAKATLESLLKTCETKLLKCTSPELPGFSKDCCHKGCIDDFYEKISRQVLACQRENFEGRGLSFEADEIGHKGRAKTLWSIV
ncbi:hypothetical protein DAPPUDRAFT_322203 [Daphnia pulex]|uniref:Uncharacterized protein n=1 Tax=Daphnia pulex TaxID=6669 RepID=E9GV84_DAPPU|nr:hypothetical protein DAPPUDRAFT_322203 [Daphnia pulex]|eukprot:EFX76656.1 hypothetical protein DAPPUDRAFT_322203 [Daphnia pulex]